MPTLSTAATLMFQYDFKNKYKQNNYYSYSLKNLETLIMYRFNPHSDNRSQIYIGRLTTLFYVKSFIELNITGQARTSILCLPFSLSVGKKVNDAAKEVTDFLNDAVGKIQDSARFYCWIHEEK